MRAMKKREVEVKYCDFCKEEVDSLGECAVCKREMCNKEGGAAHSAFSIEIYRHADGRRLISKICRVCATAEFRGVIQQLFNGMMSEDPVTTKP